MISMNLRTGPVAATVIFVIARMGGLDKWRSILPVLPHYALMTIFYNLDVVHEKQNGLTQGCSLEKCCVCFYSFHITT